MSANCPACKSSNPNLVGVMGDEQCRDPFHCPTPESHGNPFRYCPNCTWTEKPVTAQAPISRSEVAQAARATAGDYDLVGTPSADMLAYAFEKFAEKIEALP